VLARFSGGEESARKLVSALSDDVRAFAGVAEPADDVTVLALRWLG